MARVLWAGLADSDGRFATLAASLDRALEEHFDPEGRAFTPHLTLARLAPPRNLREFVPDLVGTNVASEKFVASALVLYRSHLSPAGARYEPLLVAPLWASYPDSRGRPREKLVFLGGFLAATVVAFSILLLEPSPLHAAHVFYDRTIKFQIGRHSPFSIWDWKQYGAGYPDLHLVQRVLQVLLVIGAIAVYFLPRRKTARQLAALTAALLLGFELVLTHWFYLYLPWFFPFVAFVALTAERETAAAEAPAPREHDGRALVAAG